MLSKYDAMDLKELKTAKSSMREKMAKMRKEFDEIQKELTEVKKLTRVLKDKEMNKEENKEKGKIFFKLRPTGTGTLNNPYRGDGDGDVPTIQIDLKNHPHPTIRAKGVIHIYTNECEVWKVEEAGPGYEGSWMLATDNSDTEYFVDLEEGEKEMENNDPYSRSKIGGEAYWVQGGDPLGYGGMVCQLNDSMLTIDDEGVKKALSVPWEGDGSVIVVWMNDDGDMDGCLDMH